MRTARGLAAVLSIALAGCRLEHAESGRPPGEPTAADSLARIEQDSSLSADVLTALRAYYALMSTRDWRGVRDAFWPGATVSARSAPPGDRSVRVWIQRADEYVRRTSEGPGRQAVFAERMLHSHVTGYGDVADAWVVWEVRAGRSRDSAKATRGVDAFHLLRDGGTWRIASLASTPEQPGRPLTLPARRGARPATPGRAAP